jgi:hypothetical protein
MSSAPSGTVTFLFTDIEGSTRVLPALGRDRYGEADVFLDEIGNFVKGLSRTPEADRMLATVLFTDIVAGPYCPPRQHNMAFCTAFDGSDWSARANSQRSGLQDVGDVTGAFA